MENTANKLAEQYKTSDLYLSAYLKALGLRLLAAKKCGAKVVFIFADRDDRESLIQEYFNGGLVNITRFRSELQDLKTIMYSV